MFENDFPALQPDAPDPGECFVEAICYPVLEIAEARILLLFIVVMSSCPKKMFFWSLGSDQHPLFQSKAARGVW